MAAKVFNMSKGVFSFNGRKGIVIPQTGDYTSEMVGAAPAPLSSSVNIYVNAETGNDSNPGTEQLPFKTIQAAIRSIPKNLGGYNVVVEVAPGKYDENVEITGFYNQSVYSTFMLKGATYPGSGYADETYSVKSISVTNNIADVQVDGFFVYGKGQSSNAIVASGPSVAIRYCTVKSDVAITTAINLGGYGKGHIRMLSVKVDGQYTNGVYVNAATVASITYASISGCQKGIHSDGAIVMNYAATYASNTTDESKGLSGQIFK